MTKNMPLSIRYLIGTGVAIIWSSFSLNLLFTPLPIAFYGISTIGQYYLIVHLISQVVEPYTRQNIHLEITLTYSISFCLYTSCWILIIALFASGIKKQVAFAIILFIIFTIIGFAAHSLIYIGIPGFS